MYKEFTEFKKKEATQGKSMTPELILKICLDY